MVGEALVSEASPKRVSGQYRKAGDVTRSCLADDTSGSDASCTSKMRPHQLLQPIQFPHLPPFPLGPLVYAPQGDMLFK